MRLREVSVVADRFRRTAFTRLFGENQFFWRYRLAMDYREADFIVAREERGSGGTAEIAIDATRVDVVAA
jgi:hypothetical protein